MGSGPWRGSASWCFCGSRWKSIRGLLRLVPLANRGRGAEMLHETASAIWYWMLGRLVSMTALRFLTAVGLWVICERGWELDKTAAFTSRGSWSSAPDGSVYRSHGAKGGA